MKYYLNITALCILLSNAQLSPGVAHTSGCQIYTPSRIKPIITSASRDYLRWVFLKSASPLYIKYLYIQLQWLQCKTQALSRSSKQNMQKVPLSLLSMFSVALVSEGLWQRRLSLTLWRLFPGPSSVYFLKYVPLQGQVCIWMSSRNIPTSASLSSNPHFWRKWSCL